MRIVVILNIMYVCLNVVCQICMYECSLLNPLIDDVIRQTRQLTMTVGTNDIR